MSKKKVILVIINILLALFFAWLVASFIDVNMHNKLAEDVSRVSDWNIFKLLFN